MNFTLYDVTAEFEEETVSFKRRLLQKDLSKKCNALKQAEQDLVRLPKALKLRHSSEPATPKTCKFLVVLVISNSSSSDNNSVRPSQI